MYDNCIRLFFNLLWPFKRYYISNVSVSDIAADFRVSVYEHSWTITSTTLVEEHVEPVPPTLPCTFQLTTFSDSAKFADTDNLQNIKALVIHAFPQKEHGPNLTTRDFVVVNEEKKLMLLTLWNEFEDTEGAKIANIITTVPMIIAIRLKVTTFDYEVRALFDAKAYKDTTILVPLPKEEDIVSIDQAVTASQTKKAAWIRGRARLISGQTKYWFTACMNCQKAVNAEVDWNITGPSCKEHTAVELRCRIAILLTDGTGTMNCAIFGSDAEKIIPFISARLKEVAGNEIAVNESLAESIKKHTLVCFVRFYDVDYQAQAQKKSSIVKAYTTDELLQPPPSLTYVESIPSSYGTATPAAITEETRAKEQLFTPTTKLVLDEIVVASGLLKGGSSTSTAGVKRSLPFAANLTISGTPAPEINSPANSPPPPSSTTQEPAEKDSIKDKSSQEDQRHS